jgi:hypothetical protein
LWEYYFGQARANGATGGDMPFNALILGNIVELDWMLEHPEQEYIERYLIKIGTPGEREAIRRHLLVCEECRIRLGAGARWLALLRPVLVPV